MPPQPVQTRWNSWFETVQYHSKHMHLYRGFLEAEESDAQSVERIIALLSGDSYDDIKLRISFIAESCDKLITTLKLLETTKSPIATRIFDLMEDLESVLRNGCTKVVFGTKTDEMLAGLTRAERNDYLDSFHNVYVSALSKMSKHWDQHPARAVYQHARVFDPKKVLGLSRDLDAHAGALGIEVNADVLDEWYSYRAFASSTEADGVALHVANGEIDLVNFWKGYGSRFPHLRDAAKLYMWFPVGSVDVERSFSAYKNLLSDKRYGLTQENTKNLTALYFNGDVVGRWEGFKDK